ncbi:type VI secretion system tip protein VgrG [Vibrio sp. S4M6]|uniref:type VI secretion system Vgr family protein n=1 Tax=Vibrio sinus TaxID=2946865 RepID=UPI00202A19E5|nr:type VI secretion system tip protein TssI/VgrG [Vibrio sinus]MCL9781220.1 type VI secretion system tip protein VgrG [Vibrio sinus]
MTDSELLYQPRPLIVTFADNNSYTVSLLQGKEGLSEYVNLTLSIAANTEVNKSNLGKPISILFNQYEESRIFCGLCTQISLTGFSQDKQLYYYQIKASDPLSLLSLRRSRQIFQNMSTTQILDSLLNDSGFKNYFTYAVSGNGKNHNYCVQLDESDRTFIRRLLASEGWHYHIQQSSGKPIVVIADSNQRFDSIDNATVSYQKNSQTTFRTISNWRSNTCIGTSRVLLADHTLDIADTFDSSEIKSASNYSPQNLGQEFFGLGQENKSEILNAASFQMQAMDVDTNTSEADSNIAALSSGLKFSLTQHPLSELNQEYIVTQITHHINCEERGTTPTYRNEFTCIPARTTYRPPLIDKPKIHSLHTASVTGPSDNEIYTDSAGRIKVLFHWDRNGTPDENSSCWLPVSQLLASKGFGTQFIPRVGDEVLVQYIDGNPDRPVVTGSVYNSQNTPPYSMASQIGLKTRTTPNGNSAQGNEFVLNDEKDREQIFFHAERDLVFDVNNDYTATIKGAKSTQVEKNVALTVKEGINACTEQELTMSSKENFSCDSEKDLTFSASSNMSLSAHSSVTVDGSSISITGKNNIELKVESSKISISASGIELDAPKITINGKASAEMKAATVSIEGQGTAELKSASVTVNASAMAQIKAGAMVKIQGAIAEIN